jgi:hypothetical protein
MGALCLLIIGNSRTVRRNISAPPAACFGGVGQGWTDMAGRVVDSHSTPTDPPVSPCERLWARYHESLEKDKVEIREELIQHGCLERAHKIVDGSDDAGT